MPRAIIFANGIVPDTASARALLQADDFLIAADGGLHNAHAAGAIPQVLIGDFDSITPDELAAAEKTGAQILRYPTEKDETDLGLAIRYVVENGFRFVRIVGALGGRLDQTLGNISLLADVPPYVDIRLDDGFEEVLLIGDQAEIEGEPGDTVSLLPWGIPAEGVTTEGMLYPLHGETLHPHKTRGISNELLGSQASVSLTNGKLVVIHTRRTIKERT